MAYFYSFFLCVCDVIKARSISLFIDPSIHHGFFIVHVCTLSQQVSLCSNTVKYYRVALVIDVEGVGKEIMALPIIAR